MAKLKKNSTVKTTPKAKPRGYAKGGSTVNAAGNYTKPSMRKRLVASVKAGGKVVSQDNGPPGKPRWLQSNTKQKVEDISSESRCT